MTAHVFKPDMPPPVKTVGVLARMRANLFSSWLNTLLTLFAGTVLNQTGQAIEVIAITMSVYLAISISISLLMNWYNKRIALIER